MAECKKCGAQMPDGTKFCTECGTLVEESEESVKDAADKTVTPETPVKQTPDVNTANPAPEVNQSSAPAAQDPIPQSVPQNFAQNNNYAGQNNQTPQNQNPNAYYQQPQPQQPPHPQPQYAPRQQYAQPQPQYPPQPQYIPATMPSDIPPAKGGKYSVASTGAFFGLEFVFAIPVIGWIVCLILACGATKNENLRHYARAKLIWIIISIVIWVILILIGNWFCNTFLVELFNEQYGMDFSNFGEIIEYFSSGYSFY